MSSITNGRGGNHSRPSWKIPNTKYANPTWQLHEWIILFLNDDGYENMALAANDFYRIWNDPSITEMKIRGKLYLTGKLYGCHGHHNGNIPAKRPSRVVVVKRVEYREQFEQNKKKNPFDRDVMCAITENGESFFFVKNDFNYCVMILFHDLEYGLSLEKAKNYYVHPDYCAEDIM